MVKLNIEREMFISMGLFSLEFDLEREMLMTETLPKLQQYFLAQGIYVNFIDCHLNWDLDFARNPYHVLRLIKELRQAHRTSTGLFLLVRTNDTKKRFPQFSSFLGIRGK